MNYIKLLNSAFEKFFYDDRLNPTHISLYMALFLEWNSSRFSTEFFVIRNELMRVSKIGSNSTYHRCIVELDKWGYLSYFPSNNPFKGSKIKMSILSTVEDPDMGQYDPILEHLAERYHPKNESEVFRHTPTGEQAMSHHRPVSVQALVSNINNTKHVNNNKQPKGRQAVFNFFIEKGFSVEEGRKFLEHYVSTRWKTSDNKEVRDWQALAINWMDRAELFNSKSNQTLKKASQVKDNLKTTKTKDYGQPL